jgi:hypothetical protein
MSRSLFFLFFIIALFIGASAKAQKTDTIHSSIPDSVLMKKHNPTKATIYSAILPGLGQIYNKKWWKVPIIYAGFGVMTYFIWSNTDEYLTYRSAMIEKQYGNTNGNYADLVNKYTLDELNSSAEYYRRNLEISILITSVWYILNIIDATVDAHLYTYNIDEDLSLRVSPGLIPNVDTWKPQPGISLTLKF